MDITCKREQKAALACRVTGSNVFMWLASMASGTIAAVDSFDAELGGAALLIARLGWGTASERAGDQYEVMPF